MKENAEYPLAASAEGAGLSGGQPQNYQSLKDRLGSAVMSTRERWMVVSSLFKTRPRWITYLCKRKSGQFRFGYSQARVSAIPSDLSGSAPLVLRCCRRIRCQT